ncbi:MAG: transposase, partial [Blastocatellia bacterium]
NVSQRITLVGLPAYTPELNPAERLWPLVKEGVANESFKDLGALERRVCRRVRRIGEDREILASRLNYHWWPTG